MCMVRLEERLSFGSSRRAKPLCWLLLPNKGCAFQDAVCNEGLAAGPKPGNTEKHGDAGGSVKKERLIH